MQIQPQHARLLLKVVQAVAGSNLVIPQKSAAALGDLARWVVMAVGPGTLLPDGTYAPLPVKVGDEVIIDMRLGSFTPLTPEYLFGDQQLAIVDFSAVLCTMTREPGELEKIMARMASPKIVSAAGDELVN